MQILVVVVMLFFSIVPAYSESTTPKEHYEGLLKDYEVAERSWNEKYRLEGTPEANVDWAARYRDWPGWSFAPRFVELAEANPDDPTAVDSLLWVVNRALNVGVEDQALVPHYSRALELRSQNARIDDPRVGQSCVQGLRYASPSSETFLRTLLKKSRDREIRGRACLALAKLIRDKRFIAQTRWYEEEEKSPFLEFMSKRIDPGYRSYIRQADPAALQTELQTLFERAANEFGDIVYDPRTKGTPYERTIGQTAKSDLHEFRHLSIGNIAPEITGETVDGKPLKLSDFRGKVVVLSFWATWCGPCMGMVPHERSLAKRLEGKPFVLLGIDGDEDREKAREVMVKEEMNWPSWWDKRNGDGPIATQWNVRGWPTTYVLDSKGVIRYKQVHREKLDKAVDTLLNEMETKP